MIREKTQELAGVAALANTRRATQVRCERIPLQFFEGEQRVKRILQVLDYIAQVNELSLDKSLAEAFLFVQLAAEEHSKDRAAFIFRITPRSYRSKKPLTLRELFKTRIKDTAAENTFWRYINIKSFWERNRQRPSDLPTDARRAEVITEYREQTTLLAVASLCAVAFGRRLEDFVEFYDRSEKHKKGYQHQRPLLRMREDTPDWFRALYYGQMAAQVRQDRNWIQACRHDEPTFFTALAPVRPVQDLIHHKREVLAGMDNLEEAYLEQAQAADPTFFMPLMRILGLRGLEIDDVPQRAQVPDFQIATRAVRVFEARAGRKLAHAQQEIVEAVFWVEGNARRLLLREEFAPALARYFELKQERDLLLGDLGSKGALLSRQEERDLHVAATQVQGDMLQALIPVALAVLDSGEFASRRKFLRSVAVVGGAAVGAGIAAAMVEDTQKDEAELEALEASRTRSGIWRGQSLFETGELYPLQASDVLYLGATDPAIIRAIQGTALAGFLAELGKDSLAVSGMSLGGKLLLPTTALAFLGLEFLPIVWEKLGLSSGIITRNLSASLLSFLVSEFFEKAIKAGCLQGYGKRLIWGEESRVFALSSPLGPSLNSRVSLRREGEVQLGDLSISLFAPGNAPYALMDANLHPGLLAGTQAHCVQILRDMGIEAAVGPGSWVGHHAVAWLIAMYLRGACEEQLRFWKQAFFVDAPGGSRNKWREYGAATTPTAWSQSLKWSRLLLDQGLVPLPQDDTRGFRGIRGEHVFLIYHPDGTWSYRFATMPELSRIMTGEIKLPGEWSMFKPLLIVNKQNYRILDTLNPNGLFVSALFTARAKNGSLQCGFVSADLLTAPSELWQIVEQAVQDLSGGCELQHLMYLDAGGSGGYVQPENTYLVSFALREPPHQESVLWKNDVLREMVATVGDCVQLHHTSAYHTAVMPVAKARAMPPGFMDQ